MISSLWRNIGGGYFSRTKWRGLRSTRDAPSTTDRDVQARRPRDREALGLQPAPEAHGAPRPAVLQRSPRRPGRGPRVLIGPIAVGAHRREVRREALLRRRIQRQHPRGPQPELQRGRRHLRDRVQRLRLRHRRARARHGTRDAGRVRPRGHPDTHRRIQQGARTRIRIVLVKHHERVHRDDRARRLRPPRRTRTRRHRRGVHRRRLADVLRRTRSGQPAPRRLRRRPQHPLLFQNPPRQPQTAE